MDVEIRAATGAGTDVRMAEIDAVLYPPSEAFRPEDFEHLLCFWLYVNGELAGSTQMGEHKDRSTREGYQPMPANLYVAGTQILPLMQGKGLGKIVKAWQISYARMNGFERITTNCRASNRRMLAINHLFGFEMFDRLNGYYLDPEEPGVRLERRF